MIDQRQILFSKRHCALTIWLFVWCLLVSTNVKLIWSCLSVSMNGRIRGGAHDLSLNRTLFCIMSHPLPCTLVRWVTHPISYAKILCWCHS